MANGRKAISLEEIYHNTKYNRLQRDSQMRKPQSEELQGKSSKIHSFNLGIDLNLHLHLRKKAHA